VIVFSQKGKAHFSLERVTTHKSVIVQETWPILANIVVSPVLARLHPIFSWVMDHHFCQVNFG
jgi:hypothetical protein